MQASICMWRSGDYIQVLILFFYDEDSGINLIPRLGGKHLHSLTHLASPLVMVFNVLFPLFSCSQCLGLMHCSIVSHAPRLSKGRLMQVRLL